MLFVDGGNDRVGIGTNSPSVLLDLESTAPVIRFTDSDATGTPECEVSGAGGDITIRADRDDEKSSSIIGFEVDGSEKMRIDGNGNVGIGDTSPENNSNYVALTVTSTSGSGGGQVYVQSSSVNSVFGADNSGSDPKSIVQTVTNHPLQLGTNNTQQMRIDTSGNITKPNQPSFLVYKNPSQNNLATDTTVTITFENEVFDVGTNFASNTFTAPVTGKYLLGSTLILGQPSTAAAYVSLIIKTSNRDYTAVLNDYDAFDSTVIYWSVGGTFVCDMDAGDTAFVGIYQGGGSATTDVYASTTGSIFFGHLLS